MSNGSFMFANTNIGLDSWNALLLNTQALNGNSSLTWDGGLAQYSGAPSNSASARAYLTSILGWTISDGGPDVVNVMNTQWKTDNFTIGHSANNQIKLPTNIDGLYAFPSHDRNV